jgi:2'-hydroxyisoflavone reductase
VYDRRAFLRASAAACVVGWGVAADLFGQAPMHRRRTAPMRLLILGGTGFIGPPQVRYAVERGHHVTVFNRGRRQTGLPPGVEHLIGDRNGDLEALRTGEWDVVIDNPTTLPVWVRDAASLLRDRTEHYIFISTISVYARYDAAGVPESAPLAEYRGADAFAETVESLDRDMGLYGPLKAISEAEAERWFPGRTTVIRPGLIVGPRDPTDRFTYWPARIHRGGEVLVPGEPTDPVQFIDARDLSEWIIRMAEERVAGVYNATGPAVPLGLRSMVEGMRHLAGTPVSFTQVDADFVLDHGLNPWSDLPVWVPPEGDSAGFARIDISRALERGLNYRPLATTADESLAWHLSRPEAQRTRLLAGITPEREAEVLAAWHRR